MKLMLVIELTNPQSEGFVQVFKFKVGEDGLDSKLFFNPTSVEPWGVAIPKGLDFLSLFEKINVTFPQDIATMPPGSYAFPNGYVAHWRIEKDDNVGPLTIITACVVAVPLFIILFMANRAYLSDKNRGSEPFYSEEYKNQIERERQERISRERNDAATERAMKAWSAPGGAFEQQHKIDKEMNK